MTDHARHNLIDRLMQKKRQLLTVSMLGAALLLTGCASTKVSTHPLVSANERLPKPDHILVFDFEPTSSGANSSLQAEIGKEIARGLTRAINDMGLEAIKATPTTPVRLNDILFKGEILSLAEGSASERMTIGFGEGASDLKVQMRGYQMTARGLRQLGSGTGDANSGDSPGAALGVAGAVATANPAGLIISTGMKAYGEASGSSTIEGRARQIVEEAVNRIKPKFQQQGWIQ